MQFASELLLIIRTTNYCMQEIIDWLNKKTDKYTSPEIQNELLGLMSHTILRQLVKQVKLADYFTIMLDECVDGSNKEQLAVCFRYVDSNLIVNEEFMGLYHCPDIKADTSCYPRYTVKIQC